MAWKRLAVLTAIILFLAPAFSTQAAKAEEAQPILIWFSDMNLTPAPTLVSYNRYDSLVSSGVFTIDSLDGLTQAILCIHYKAHSADNCKYTIVINGETYFSDSLSYSYKEDWTNVTLGVEALKEGENTTKITLEMWDTWENGAGFVIYLDSFLYITSEAYSPPFRVTYDISGYLTELRVEQINLRHAVEDLQTQIASLANQTGALTDHVSTLTSQASSLADRVTSLENRIKTLTYLTYAIIGLLGANIAVLALTRRR